MALMKGCRCVSEMASYGWKRGALPKDEFTVGETRVLKRSAAKSLVYRRRYSRFGKGEGSWNPAQVADRFLHMRG